MTVLRALLFDIGEVVSAAPWPMLDELERTTGRSFPHRGPADPDGDPLWRRYLAGELSYTGYWVAVATAAGYDDWKDFYRDVGDLPVEWFTDPDAEALIADAHRAGVTIGALTNEGAAINGMGFFDRVPAFAVFDAILDAAEFGERKPAPATYLRAAASLGVDPGQVVFLDDTPVCVWGAEQVGMVGVLVDPADRVPAFDRTRRLLGLAAPSAIERLTAEVDAAYGAGDVDRIMALFDPDVVVTWDGERVAVGLAEARHFHLERLGIGRRELRCTTRLRVEGDDAAAVERCWTTPPQGSTTVTTEVWTLRRGKFVEWSSRGGAP